MAINYIKQNFTNDVVVKKTKLINIDDAVKNACDQVDKNTEDILKNAEDIAENASQINGLADSFSNIGRKYVLLGAANSSTGSSDVKGITLNDDFTKYNELMFVMDINGTQYNPTIIPVERFYNASTIAISHTDDGGTIWTKAISYSTTSVGYSASSNIVTLAIYGVI